MKPAARPYLASGSDSESDARVTGVARASPRVARRLASRALSRVAARVTVSRPSVTASRISGHDRRGPAGPESDSESVCQCSASSGLSESQARVPGPESAQPEPCSLSGRCLSPG